MIGRSGPAVAKGSVNNGALYEAADFVKTRWKIISFIFDPFWPPFDNNSPLWLWC